MPSETRWRPTSPTSGACHFPECASTLSRSLRWGACRSATRARRFVSFRRVTTAANEFAQAFVSAGRENTNCRATNAAAMATTHKCMT